MDVLGLDSCRDGWIVVLWSAERATTHFFSHIDEVERFAPVAIIAIDTPMGLSTLGNRRCDFLVRQALPGRASMVFSAPPRACHEVADDEVRVDEISRVRGVEGLSRQSFGRLK